MNRSLHARHLVAALAVATAVGIVTACNDTTTTAPVALDPAGTFQSALAPESGTGNGGVSVTPSAIADGYFNARIKVRLHGAKASTTYYVQRAPEIGRANGSDGICQRAQGMVPWSSADAPAAAFVSFAPTAGATPIAVTTTAAGDGAVDFDFSAPTIPTGTKFDVMFRLVDDLATPTIVFKSGCFTVTVL